MWALRRLDGLVNIYSDPCRAPVIVVDAATAMGVERAMTTKCLERLCSLVKHSGTISHPRSTRKSSRLPGRFSEPESGCTHITATIDRVERVTP